MMSSKKLIFLSTELWSSGLPLVCYQISNHLTITPPVNTISMKSSTYREREEEVRSYLLNIRYMH